MKKKGGSNLNEKLRLFVTKVESFILLPLKFAFLKKKCHKWSDQCDAAPYIIAKSIEK